MADLTDLRKMVSAFRLTELQMLLSYAGQSKHGRKQEIFERAMALLTRDPPLSIRMKIHELYKSRFPSSSQRNDVIPPIVVPPPAVSVSASTRLHGGSSYASSGAALPAVGLKSSKVVPPDTFKSSDIYKATPPSHSHMPWQLPVHPEVRLKSLPFYDVQGELIKPSALVAKPGSSQYQETSFTFHLTSDQAKIISSSGRIVNYEQTYSTQVQLRFCLLETSCEQEDCFPSGICVKVNGKMATLPNPIPTNKPGVEPKRPGRPVNITPICKLQATSTNQIVVTWNADPTRNFCMSAYVVHQLNTAILLDRLKKSGQRHADHTRAIIKEKMTQDPDSEIATTSLRVSLICPLGKVKMTIPCRSSLCNHVQCCDAATFLQMNEKKPTWTCPVCDKPTEFKTLIIDGLLMDILRQCPDAKEIQFNEGGQWNAVRDADDKKKSPSSSNSKLPLNVETIADSPEKQPVVSKSPPPQAAVKKSADIIDLTMSDSDEEEEEQEEERPDDDDTAPGMSSPASSSMSVLSTDSNERNRDNEPSSSSGTSNLYSIAKRMMEISSSRRSTLSTPPAKTPSPLSVATADSPSSIVSIMSPSSPTNGQHRRRLLSPISSHSQRGASSIDRAWSPPILLPEPLVREHSPQRTVTMSQSRHQRSVPPPAHQHHSSSNPIDRHHHQQLHHHDNNHYHRHHRVTAPARSNPYPSLNLGPTYESAYDNINWNPFSNNDYYDFMSSSTLLMQATDEVALLRTDIGPTSNGSKSSMNGLDSANSSSSRKVVMSDRASSSSSSSSRDRHHTSYDRYDSHIRSSAVPPSLWPAPPSWSQSDNRGAPAHLRRPDSSSLFFMDDSY